VGRCVPLAPLIVTRGVYIAPADGGALWGGGHRLPHYIACGCPPCPRGRWCPVGRWAPLAPLYRTRGTFIAPAGGGALWGGVYRLPHYIGHGCAPCPCGLWCPVGRWAPLAPLYSMRGVYIAPPSFEHLKQRYLPFPRGLAAKYAGILTADRAYAGSFCILCNVQIAK